MMYKSNLVASVKCGGKILREKDDTVFLPFGSEYSLLFKNLNTQRALVKITIDGRDVVPGGLIISANQTVDLERFVVDQDLDKGPRFKFIEKTEQISEHRGDKIDDGLIRIEYQYEKSQVLFAQSLQWPEPHNVYYSSRNVISSVNNVTRSVKGGAMNTATLGAMPESDAGITVNGTESSQKFVNGHMGSLESDKHVIVLNLKGAVSAPVTVKTKIKCQACGKKHKSDKNFCSECGNNLTYTL